MIPPILAVEDNEDDAFALRRAIRRTGLEVDLQLVEDGKSALDYLLGDAHPVPSLVFLDLKLPYVSGLEVLATLRQTEGLQDLPVVILSGSDEARDHARANELGVQGYLVKPPEPDMIIGFLRRYGYGGD